MEQETAINCFAAIAHPGRLALMRRLIKAGPEGVTSGDLALAENLKASTTSAQLLVLSQSGLVTSQRNGKQVIYQAQYKRFQALIAFMIEDCCAGNTYDK